MNRMHAFRHLALVLALGQAFGALAQTAPDAGQILQQTQAPRLQAPRPNPGPAVEPSAATATPRGGVQITLQRVHFADNTVFDETQLLAVLGDVTGKRYDLAGLKALAQQITQHYRAAGYPFARALVPVQPLRDGSLRIEVVEGRYGRVKAVADDALVLRAERFLHPLTPGQVIESSALERATLLLDDQPGIQTTAVIRPGEDVGTGDLEVRVERTRGYGMDLSLDNHGNRYTGTHRATANLHIDSPFTLGDQITANALATEDSLWLGALGYQLPLGSSGLRGSVGYSHTYYQIGKELASSKALGTAAVSTLGLSYPLVRSQMANLSVSGNYQEKRLNDQKTGANENKSSEGLVLRMSYDMRDSLGGGVSYGALTWTTGSLHLDSSLQAADGSAQTKGAFEKLNLDLARLQTLSWGGASHFSLYARVAAQWTYKNLDSSEDFGLGGATGVRAYPSGEAFGDMGWLTQLELRYNAGAYAPYVFYDVGSVSTNAVPWASGVNDRKLAGAGLGLRYTRGGWNSDAALAWRLEGGRPQADTTDKSDTGPQAWFLLGYKY